MNQDKPNSSTSGIEAGLQSIAAALFRLNDVGTVDANGWTLLFAGAKRIWVRKYLWTGSVSMAQYSNITLPSLALPVGISNRGGMVLNFMARCSDRTFLVNERQQDSVTNITFEVNEWHNATITLTYVQFDMIAIEL